MIAHKKPYIKKKYKKLNEILNSLNDFYSIGEVNDIKRSYYFIVHLLEQKSFTMPFELFKTNDLLNFKGFDETFLVDGNKHSENTLVADKQYNFISDDINLYKRNKDFFYLILNHKNNIPLKKLIAFIVFFIFGEHIDIIEGNSKIGRLDDNFKLNSINHKLIDGKAYHPYALIIISDRLFNSAEKALIKGYCNLYGYSLFNINEL